MSALLLARGLAGPDGKIVVADSESRRASLYADVIPGGFSTFDLGVPFTSLRYVEAVDAIEASGAAVGIIDSGSHEWEGPGGVCDLALEKEEKSGRPGLHNWKVPKDLHSKFVQRLLRLKIPLIVCLRAKYKTRQKKDEKGKTIIIKDEFTSPIQAEDFIFEATAHFEILPNHSIIVTKCSHPQLRLCLPEDKTTPITIEHGDKLAKWCAAPGGKTPIPPVTDESSLEKMLKELQPYGEPLLQQFAETQGWLTPAQTLKDWPAVHRPNTRGEMRALMAEIEAFQKTTKSTAQGDRLDEPR